MPTETEWEIRRETIYGDKPGEMGHNLFVKGMHIGSYMEPKDVNNEVESRARIVKSAPQLLQVCEDLEAHIKEMPPKIKSGQPTYFEGQEIRNRMIALIAKARVA